MANMAGQEVALYVNALDRTIQKNGVTKAINDDFWTSDIVPILYPVWDSDRDKLESYIRYKAGATVINKNKNIRNQKTGVYSWSSYQLDTNQFTSTELDELWEKLDRKYTEYREVEDYNLEQALTSLYAKDNYINWNKLVMIRKFLLLDSDWTQTADAPITAEEKAQWVTYRQKLRDITEASPLGQKGVPAPEVKFPITPSKYKQRKAVAGTFTGNLQVIDNGNQANNDPGSTAGGTVITNASDVTKLAAGVGVTISAQGTQSDGVVVLPDYACVTKIDGTSVTLNNRVTGNLNATLTGATFTAGDSYDYLADTINHFFYLNQSVYRKYSDRILTYLSIAISTETIDSMPVSRIYDSNASTNLDTILEQLENGGS